MLTVIRGHEHDCVVVGGALEPCSLALNDWKREEKRGDKRGEERRGERCGEVRSEERGEVRRDE